MNPDRLPRLLAATILLAGLAACGTTGGVAEDLELSKDPLVGKFVWHDLVTDDVEVARRFYGRLLGWEFEDTRHPRGGEYTLIKADGTYIGGMVRQADGEDADYSRWLPYLSVADVDRAVDLNRSAGGEVLVGPLDLPGVGRAAAVTDPQGAVLGLLRSRPGDPLDRAETGFGQVSWNELVAADDAAAADFYQRLADYDVREVQRRGGEYRFLRAQGQDRAGVLQRPNGDIPPQWLTHFAVTDVPTAARRSAELGGQVLLAPSDDIRDGGFAIVSDPTGALLALTEFAR